MLLSSLSKGPSFQSPLKNVTSPREMCSIEKIQSLIENAWNMGIDAAGAEQLERRLVNTTKWIGATEIYALLTSRHIKYDCSKFVHYLV